MELLKEKYIPETRTTYNEKKFNQTDHIIFEEFTVDDKSFKVYKSLNVIDEQWDDFVYSVENSCFQQLSGWADIKKLEGWDFIRIIYVIDNKILAGYQLLTKKIFWGLKIAYLNHGPVIKIKDNVFIKIMFNHLLKVLRKEKVLISVISPSENFNEIRDDFNSHYQKNVMYKKIIEAEAELDLSLDENTLLKRMLRMRRQNIKKGEFFEHKIVEGGYEDLQDFFSLMVETCKRNNVKPNPPNFESLEKIWEYFHSRNLLKLYKFLIKDELVSAVLVFEYQDKFIPWKYGWSGKHSSLKPNDVFHWELLKLAKSKGFTKYNLGGINKSVAERFLSKECMLSEKGQKSSTFFKMGFGCYIKKLPESFIYISNPLLRMVYNFFITIRKYL